MPLVVSCMLGVYKNGLEIEVFISNLRWGSNFRSEASQLIWLSVHVYVTLEYILVILDQRNCFGV